MKKILFAENTNNPYWSHHNIYNEPKDNKSHTAKLFVSVAQGASTYHKENEELSQD